MQFKTTHSVPNFHLTLMFCVNYYFGVNVQFQNNLVVNFFDRARLHAS